ncbi:hypothetical protein BDP27DRAFT_996828 [Rhodocollybia butyracea]|uniref:Uncharacterized protein n=1 Tax=Rhodocollybia butyracea TaxID=206335 RepID=A0A9P5PNZ3_9AGAR|nr:hypothetical protein BDP27DRAFT_996828 [Rhodocollybia butyracea]
MDIEEEESLFGSPPTSPRIGRSPSPTLALPSTSGSVVNLQNVGTIALPGSHYNSELSMNPLALPLNCLPPEAASRPPAHLQTNFTHLAGRTWSPQASTSSTPSSSRASSQGPSQSKGKRGKRRRADDEPLIRRPPPEIPLPDPTAPVPPNWLRSQSALLGHAGLVGGVKPATLSNRHSRGSTSVNPIVIDDDQREHSSRHRHPASHHIHPNLPTPPIDEIVQILIGQREVFTLLQDILNLMETSSPLSHHSASDPAFKKRKLGTAAAWEVPHPGEGSRDSRDKDKGKQLISRLVSLIKSASRTAALRRYLAKDRSSKLMGSQEAGLIKELEHAMPKDILTDASNSPVKTLNPSAFPPLTPESSPFDDLLASLLTVKYELDTIGRQFVKR